MIDNGEQPYNEKEAGYRLMPITPSLSDYEWNETQEYVARRIACVFGITLQELGLTETER